MLFRSMRAPLLSNIGAFQPCDGSGSDHLRHHRGIHRRHDMRAGNAGNGGKFPEDFNADALSFLAGIGGRFEAVEGEWRPSRLVLIEFPSWDEARSWYFSDAYQELVRVRQGCSHTEMVLVEGHGG